MDGVSQYVWSTRWWEAVGSADNAGNPLYSDNGSESLDLINSAGSSVYFLTGAVGTDPTFSGPQPGAINRTARAYSNQHIFFPIYNYAEWQSVVASGEVCTTATDVIESTVINTIYATLDGSDLTGGAPTNFRQGCAGQPNLAPYPVADQGVFEFSHGPGSLFEYFGAASPDQYATDGYWLMLEPLAAGTYELQFGGRFNEDFVQDNTYTLRVVDVPSAPGPLPVLGAAAAFGTSRRLRKRIARSRTLPAADGID